MKLLIIDGCDQAVDIVREFLKVSYKQCEARTIKGKQCMKCAKEGEVLCAVHIGLSVYRPPDKKKPEETPARCIVCGKGCGVLCFGNMSRLRKEWDERNLKV